MSIPHIPALRLGKPYESLDQVLLSPDLGEGDVYPADDKSNKFRLTGQALRKLTVNANTATMP